MVYFYSAFTGLIKHYFYIYSDLICVLCVCGSFIQRYLTAHQRDVTRILAYLVQACHELVPPEELLPVLKAIAHNFITERCANEVIAVGMNAVREIIARCPALLHEDGMGDFVQDLAQYSRKTHKSVMVAAHSVINLVRWVAVFMFFCRVVMCIIAIQGKVSCPATSGGQRKVS